MVRDIILDMKERDLLIEDKSNHSMPSFDSIWGNIFDEDQTNEALICNIIVPEAYWNMIQYNSDNELIICFNSIYTPNTENFRVRLVALKDGCYSLFKQIRGDFGILVSSFALNKNIAAPISASMLPFIDIDGEFLLKLVKSTKSEILDKAYIYSSKQTDIRIGYSDDQASQLLSLCAPGKSYRYPTTGVGIVKYLNRVIAHSDLQDVLEFQFERDNRPLQYADFDNESGKLDVLFSPEIETIDKNLSDLDNLNRDFFKLFSDDFVRMNTVLNEVADKDFIELLNNYSSLLCLILFTDANTHATRIANNVVEGEFDCDGKIIPSAEYFVISTTLEGNSIIMFDDEHEDKIANAPVFTINDTDETLLYTSLIEQPYWISESCHKCFILKKRACVKYMVKQDRFRAGKGLYLVPQTSSNIKNMVGLVQDDNTGVLLGIVSNNTNISDMTLDEVTQHIYATQMNQ